MLKTFYLVCLSFLLIGTDLVRCESDYVFSLEAGGWLKLYSTPAAWEEAFVRCHNDDAVLASPLNKQLADALHMQMSQNAVNSHIFLGIHDLFSKGRFVSVEGIPLFNMDIKWGPNGDRTSSGECLTMSVDGSVHFSACQSPLPYVCLRKLNNQTLNECGTVDNEYRYNQQTDSCYKIHASNETWSRAYSICASEGSHLVILNDENEANIVKDMFPAPSKYYPWDGFHIGLRAWGKERIWTTIHGEKIENVYNKWSAGEPNNWLGIGQDRAIYLWSGYLDDVNGTAQFRRFACEKSPDTEWKKYIDVNV